MLTKSVGRAGRRRQREARARDRAAVLVTPVEDQPALGDLRQRVVLRPPAREGMSVLSTSSGTSTMSASSWMRRKKKPGSKS